VRVARGGGKLAAQGRPTSTTTPPSRGRHIASAAFRDGLPAAVGHRRAQSP
jgi:hypothetical protein